MNNTFSLISKFQCLKFRCVCVEGGGIGHETKGQHERDQTGGKEDWGSAQGGEEQGRKEEMRLEGNH